MTPQPPQDPTSRRHLHRTGLDEFPVCRPPVFVTWGRLARTIAEIAGMRTRASHQEPTAQKIIAVNE